MTLLTVKNMQETGFTKRKNISIVSLFILYLWYLMLSFALNWWVPFAGRTVTKSSHSLFRLHLGKTYKWIYYFMDWKRNELFIHFFSFCIESLSSWDSCMFTERSDWPWGKVSCPNSSAKDMGSSYFLTGFWMFEWAFGRNLMVGFFSSVPLS